MVSIDPDRRAPTLARHELAADPRMLRSALRQVERNLGEVGLTTRRKLMLLIGALANEWTDQCSWQIAPTMVLDVEQLSDRVRVEAFSHATLPDDFWSRLGTAVAPGRAAHWGVERRGQSGVWFEIETDAAKHSPPFLSD